MKQVLRLNSFFAGIGGFDLGLKRSGIEVSLHCEINPFCQSVLQRHWPETPLEKDITAIEPANLPEAEIWAGGFPCQDVSVARGWLGRDGLKGKRSGLFHAFLELIANRLPTVVLLENVTGLLSSHDGRDFEVIVKSLTDLGYGVAWRILNSRYFGAPQSRSRVFVCAWMGSVQRAVRVLYEDLASPPPANERAGFLRACKVTKSGAMVPEVGYCLAATSGRHTGTDWSRSYVSYADRVRRLTPGECEGLQGFPKAWTLPEPDFHAIEDLDSLRYAALGNAVSVPVVEWIGARVLREWTSRKARDVNGLSALMPFPTLNPKTMLKLGGGEVGTGKFKWTSGGCAFGTDCLLTTVSPAPNAPIASKLGDLIENGKIADKYFLSPNAAEGILRRVHSQGRTLFGPLEDALARLAESKYSQAADLNSPIVAEGRQLLFA